MVRTNVSGTFNADVLEASEAFGIEGSGVLFESGSFYGFMNGAATARPADFTDTNSTAQATGSGVFPTGQLPEAATLYGWHIARFGNDTGGETTTLTPEFEDAAGSTAKLTELQITSTGSMSTESVGPVEITSIGSGLYSYRALFGQVTAGTGLVEGAAPSVVLAWRVD